MQWTTHTPSWNGFLIKLNKLRVIAAQNFIQSKNFPPAPPLAVPLYENVPAHSALPAIQFPLLGNKGRLCSQGGAGRVWCGCMHRIRLMSANTRDGAVQQRRMQYVDLPPLISQNRSSLVNLLNASDRPTTTPTFQSLTLPWVPPKVYASPPRVRRNSQTLGQLLDSVISRPCASPLAPSHPCCTRRGIGRIFRHLHERKCV